MIKARTIPGWFHLPEAKQFKNWVEENSEFVEWNYKSGITTLNGEVYPTNIMFHDDSFASVCKLTFPELLWFNCANAE